MTEPEDKKRGLRDGTDLRDGAGAGDAHSPAPHDPAAAAAAAEDRISDQALERAFAAARDQAKVADALPDALSARILADASALAPASTRALTGARMGAPTGAPTEAAIEEHGRSGPGTATAAERAFALLSRVLDPLGFGLPTATALAVCAAMGLWLGYAPPAGLDGLGAALLAETRLVERYALQADALMLGFDLGAFDG